LDRLRETPRLPRAAREPRAVRDQAVSATAVLPRTADALRNGARRHGERLRRRRIADVAVEPELVLCRELLKRRRLPAEIEPGRQPPRPDALGLCLAAGFVAPIARGRRDGEEIEARVELRRSELRPLDVARVQYAGGQQR